MSRVDAAPFDTPEGLALLGPTVRVHISFDSNLLAGFSEASQEQEVPALVDTGAQESSIDSELANELGLLLVDQQVIAGAGGRHTVDVFLAQIYVPDLGQTLHGHFAGVHLAQGDMPHKAILGRDFLSRCVMIYDGPENRVTLLI